MEINNIRILGFPKIICWIIFFTHFIFLVLFHGVSNFVISKYDLIVDIIILIILQSISLFITLSEIHNSYTFYKFSIFFSIINILAILISILDYIFFIIKKKDENKSLVYILLFFKIIEILSLIILISINKKIKKSPGNIEKALKKINNVGNIDENIE